MIYEMRTWTSLTGLGQNLWNGCSRRGWRMRTVADLRGAGWRCRHARSVVGWSEARHSQTLEVLCVASFVPPLSAWTAGWVILASRPRGQHGQVIVSIPRILNDALSVASQSASRRPGARPSLLPCTDPPNAGNACSVSQWHEHSCRDGPNCAKPVALVISHIVGQLVANAGVLLEELVFETWFQPRQRGCGAFAT